MDDIGNYDFQEFPGVVDRTFISSLMVAVFAYPFKFVLTGLGLSCLYMLHICKHQSINLVRIARIILGVMNFISLKILRNAIMDVYKDKELYNAFFIVIT